MQTPARRHRVAAAEHTLTRNQLDFIVRRMVQMAEADTALRDRQP
jgi:hypothetical protein